jgi:hypothetical protein
MQGKYVYNYERLSGIHCRHQVVLQLRLFTFTTRAVCKFGSCVLSTRYINGWVRGKEVYRHDMELKDLNRPICVS